MYIISVKLIVTTCDEIVNYICQKCLHAIVVVLIIKERVQTGKSLLIVSVSICDIIPCHIMLPTNYWFYPYIIRK